MLVLAKIGLVLASMVYLMRVRVNVGAALGFSAVFMGLLFGMGVGEVAWTWVLAATSEKTLYLLGIVLSITFLGNVLKHMENLGRVVESLERLIPDARIVVASIPAFIGLLPMPGGAMLSAPLTGEVAKKMGADANMKTAINYWFRHVWEYTFPLYPGVILSAALFDVSYSQIFVANGPANVAAVFFGVLFLLRGLNGKGFRVGVGFWEGLKTLIVSVAPIAAVIVADLVFGFDILASVLAVLFFLFIQSKMFRGFRAEVFRESITLSLCVLVVSVMAFEAVVKESGAVDELPAVFDGYGVPVPLIVFFVPFVVGLLTGITMAYVGTAFPLLSGFIAGPGGVDFGYFMLAYVGGFMGVMVSPVHLCLVLSREYYGGEMGKVYAKLVGPVVGVSAVAAGLYFLGWPPSM